MPEVAKPEVVKLNISKLTPQKSGNYAILIDGEILGEISAFPKASFVIPAIDPETRRPKPVVLGDGTHSYAYKGRKLSIAVKDLEREFMGEGKPETVEANNRAAQEEVLSRVVVIEL